MICHALTPSGSEPSNLGNIPLMIITAGARTRGTWEQAWQEMQAELAGWFTCSTHIVADRAGHHVNRDDPGCLVQAVRSMIDKLR
jgi:pimeloyl-ACP methyl ester carboxylesterase